MSRSKTVVKETMLKYLNISRNVEIQELLYITKHRDKNRKSGVSIIFSPCILYSSLRSSSVLFLYQRHKRRCVEVLTGAILKHCEYSLTTSKCMVKCSEHTLWRYQAAIRHWLYHHHSEAENKEIKTKTSSGTNYYSFKLIVCAPTHIQLSVEDTDHSFWHKHRLTAGK